MNIDRIVVTTFPGYFFSQILCLRSIQRHAAGFPIDIIIDDFGLTHWHSYVQDCKQYILANFPELDITFHCFSEFDGMARVKTGGWFRQQLVKLYLDQFVSGQRWLLVDADVCFEEPPELSRISATVRRDFSPVDIGNRLYAGFMLNCEQPWAVRDDEYWCMSGVPFRPVDRTLLQNLRQHIESIHAKTVFDLHLDLFENNQLVAFDPAGQTMIMSEFQLIEIFRHRYSDCPLPIELHAASKFSHTSIKDWNLGRECFEQQQVLVSDQHWQHSQQFGQHHV